MRRVLASATIVGALAVTVTMATQSFFADSETSAGNTFAAGEIDLTLGGWFHSNANGPAEGPLVTALGDQNNTVMFAFRDLKPGDAGGGYFDMQVKTNPAWACMKTSLDDTPENTRIEPEEGFDPTDAADSGELQNHLQLAFWYDLNSNGTFDPSTEDAVGPYTMAQLSSEEFMSLSDSTNAGPFNIPGNPNPMDPTPDIYRLGVRYCFGQFDMNTLTCGGATAQMNDAQTDGIEAGFQFNAIQYRGNEGFACDELDEQGPVTPPTES